MIGCLHSGVGALGRIAWWQTRSHLGSNYSLDKGKLCLEAKRFAERMHLIRNKNIELS
jgi:hypothetical protein